MRPSEPLTLRRDLDRIREHARANLSDGAFTAAYGANRDQVVEVLNDVLATEIVCTLRYRTNYFMAAGKLGEAIADEFMEHAGHEQAHADRVALRITQLGGVPDMNPATVSKRSHADYVASEDLQAMICENLVAERIAIEAYSAIVRWLGDRDPTTRRLMEDILAQEEEHADELADLLGRLGRTHS